MIETEQPKVSWWRFPLAILLFILVYIFLPKLIGIMMTIGNLFIPSAYQNTSFWIFIVSDIMSAVTGFYLVDYILLNQKYAFQAVWAAIVAIYSFVVSITNWVMFSSTLEQFLGVLSMGIVAIVFVALSCKKNSEINSSK